MRVIMAAGVFPIVRSFPKVGLADSRMANVNRFRVFYDHEIREVHQVINTTMFTLPNGFTLKVTNTVHDVPIIQQQCLRGCTAATAAMMILQNGKMLSEYQSQLLYRCGLRDESQIEADLSYVGLRSRITNAYTLQNLRSLLLDQGTGIAEISDSDVGGHSIILDEVSEDLQTVRLRDPFHGWEISVNSEAVVKRHHDLKVLQVV